ncbi:hypothetical protein GCWU000282_00559 [Catonella morbi ATCC 51271]|uniref:Transposase DDE domain-containing protein n=1 Tax=Catonella morbi ATCC 51271 TaxID=592026 RepID=V2Y966_9FIRM|nr:transposase [Catonella morbi]ESL04211.1 hypothetical protein GCWU000282_00559 [Catonella morbi ATCC 51271]
MDEKSSVVVDYQYDVNTTSDASFVKEYIQKSEALKDTEILTADSAYASEEASGLAAEKNITLLTTGLLGRKPKEIFGKFTLDKTGSAISSCPAGNSPKRSSYIKQSYSIRFSFNRNQCEVCSYREQCNPKLNLRTSVMLIPLKSRRRVLESAYGLDEEARTFITRIRNGIETVPSIIRNKYRADKMPVRGKLKTKLFFGFKVVALNFSKLIRFTKKKLKCITFETV